MNILNIVTNKCLFLLSSKFDHSKVFSTSDEFSAQIASVLVIPSKKKRGIRGKIENVLEMASAKYRNLFQYLKKNAYPEGFPKQKTTLRKFAKKFEYDSKLESLFYVAKEKDGTALRRLVITEDEKARVFEAGATLLLSLDTPAAIILFAPCEGCSQGVVLGRN